MFCCDNTYSSQLLYCLPCTFSIIYFAWSHCCVLRSCVCLPFSWWSRMWCQAWTSWGLYTFVSAWLVVGVYCACGTMKLLLLCLFPSGLSLFLFVGLFFAGCPGLSPCTRLASWFNDCVFVCPLSVLDLECLLLEWFFCLFVLCSFVNVPVLCPCSRRAAVRQPRILCWLGLSPCLFSISGSSSIDPGLVFVAVAFICHIWASVFYLIGALRIFTLGFFRLELCFVCLTRLFYVGLL